MNLFIILVRDGERATREVKEGPHTLGSHMRRIFSVSAFRETLIIRLNAAICSCSSLCMCLSYVFQYAVMPYVVHRLVPW